MYDRRIINGFLVSSQDIQKLNLYIENGKIAAATPEVLEAKNTFDASGLYIMPGCIDGHVHFRDPGQTHKEDFAHATRAAAVGGVTTVCEMPNTNPPTTNSENFRAKVEGFIPQAYADFALWGLALGEYNLKNFQELMDEGAIALKFFWGYAFDANNFQLVYNFTPGMTNIIPPLDDGEVYELFQEIARVGATVAIHAENHSIVQRMTAKVLKSGRRDYEALLEARPNLAEELTIQSAITLSKATGARLHILHMSTQEGVELVRAAQEKGLPVTAETCPHFLFLDASDYERIGPMMKVYPPIKRQSDRLALWQALKDGVISVIGSDHAPHTIEEKTGDIFSMPAGMCSVETMLPLMLNEVSHGRITFPFVVQKLAENPAKLFNLYPQKGSLNPGADADLVIVDLNKQQEIRNEHLHSKQPLTAFHGMNILGWPVATFLRGQQIAANGEILDGPLGQFVKPQR